MNELDLATKQVTWLLAMPISDAEYTYLQGHGEDAFERISRSKASTSSIRNDHRRCDSWQRFRDDGPGTMRWTPGR